MESNEPDFRPLGCMMKIALSLVVVMVVVVFFLGIVAGLVFAATL